MSRRTRYAKGKGALAAPPRARVRERPRERLCIATRTTRPVDQLIRFVIAPDGGVVPDIKRKLPGRGLWITATRELVEEAVRRNLFARAFGQQVNVTADLAGQTEQLLQGATLAALAIAGKTGLVATGFARTAAALDQGQVVALVCASGTSSGCRRRLMATARRQTPPLSVIEFLTSAQLDLALNRPNVVHAALLAGPATDTFMSRSRRLERYRSGGASNRSDRTGTGAAHRAGSLYMGAYD